MLDDVRAGIARKVPDSDRARRTPALGAFRNDLAGFASNDSALNLQLGVSGTELARKYPLRRAAGIHVSNRQIQSVWCRRVIRNHLTGEQVLPQPSDAIGDGNAFVVLGTGGFDFAQLNPRS